MGGHRWRNEEEAIEFLPTPEMPVVVDELVISLDTRFTDLLADIRQLFARLHNARVYKFKLRSKGFCRDKV